jgi:hypothetical protein
MSNWPSLAKRTLLLLKVSSRLPARVVAVVAVDVDVDVVAVDAAVEAPAGEEMLMARRELRPPLMPPLRRLPPLLPVPLPRVLKVLRVLREKDLTAPGRPAKEGEGVDVVAVVVVEEDVEELAGARSLENLLPTLCLLRTCPSPQSMRN